jgi:hypothetical protein
MTEQETEQLEAFKVERNRALLSLDEETIRAYCWKYNGSEMPQGEVFWGAVHKAITGNTELPIEFRRKSKAWLTERGLHSLDDGDL